MKLNYLAFIFAFIFLAACDDARLFEKNIDFNQKVWVADSVTTFDFQVDNNDKPYNIYLNVRNTNTYPYYNLYVKYSLEDTLGNVLESDLVNYDLFHEKTGKPFGAGLGDIFSHQFPLQEDYKFPNSGGYQIKLQQYMRQDSLQGIVSAGVRIENAMK